DQRVVLVRAPVRASVTLRGAVTAPDVTAAHTDAQVKPACAVAQAVLATVGGRCHVLDRVQVRARTGHPVLLDGVTFQPSIQPTRAARRTSTLLCGRCASLTPAEGHSDAHRLRGVLCRR